MRFTHDVIVIGAGSAGLTAAGGCALFGLKVALIEAGAMGGECLNTGCVPSKALLAAAQRAAAARRAGMGITLAAPQIEWVGVRDHIAAAIAAIEPHDSQERFEEIGCEILREHARLIDRYSVVVGNRTLTAPRIVLATGSRPALPPIDGLDAVPFLTNENLFELEELPRHLAIVGGGNIGMEMAQAFRRLGSEVTVLEPHRPLGRDDEEAAALVVASLKCEGVRFITGKAASVEGSAGALRLHTEGGEAIDASHLLLATGRRANTDGLGLEAAGVRTSDNGIEVDARRRTSVKSIYAIGDCRDGPRLTHVSGHEGSNVALEVALGIPTKVDWTALPWCTYTDPELAQIGLTEADAREKHGDGIIVEKQPFSDNDRALAEGSSAGFVKLICKGRKVVGATIVGEQAGELLLPVSQMITGKASTFALGSAIVAYPTRAEALKAAAFARWEPAVFGSLPRCWAALVAKVRRSFA